MLLSIREQDLRRHVDVLAADTYEGREGGSRGGRAAGVYLERELRRLNLAGGAAGGSYYQPFTGNHRNLLAVIPGSDPELADQVIVVGAHYDHVGYGNRDNSFGPIGYIHNGADDNASGTAGLLELIEAYQISGATPRRTLLFAFWDGEEKGLLGSYHWCRSPTVPLARVPLMVNLDMIGRLRSSRIEVVGSRTSPGLRELLSRQNVDPEVKLDFVWQLKEDSDHYAFITSRVPAVMLHTGLHDDYHRPSDDVEKLNYVGLREVTRLLVRLVDSLAQGVEIDPYRGSALNETDDQRRRQEAPLPPLPGRLGVSFREGEEDGAGAQVVLVRRGSAAEAAGIQVGDVIREINGEQVTTTADILPLVLAAPPESEVVVERAAAPEPLRLPVLLDGEPVRIGISWRVDDAEPNAVALARVVPGSPAGRAGLLVNDRVYRVDGQSFAGSQEFSELLAGEGPWQLEVERNGRVFLQDLSLAR